MLFASFGFLIVLLYSCGTAVPTKELADAKAAIERAKSVDAPVYASQDFMEAQDDLDKANSSVDAKKNQDAHDQAVMAKIAADKSYESARTARAEDIYQKCSNSMSACDQNFANKIDPDKYAFVTNGYSGLQAVYDKKDYDSIYSNGVLLYPKVKDLAEYSSGMVNKAKDEVATAQNSYDEAADKEIVRQFAMDDLKAAEPLIDDARTSLTSGDLDNTVTKAKKAEAMIAEAEKKAQDAYQLSLKNTTNTTQTVDIGKQQEMEKEKKEASDAIETAKKKLEQLKTRLKGTFLGGALGSFSYVEFPFICLGDDISSPGHASNSNVSTPGASSSIQVKDEDITQDMVEKYINMAQNAYDREEYLDAIDYANEASRMSDILLARELFKIYTVKLRPLNRDCLWKISGYMYDNQWALWPVIWRANKYQIQDPDLIYPGQELKIPPVPAK